MRPATDGEARSLPSAPQAFTARHCGGRQRLTPRVERDLAIAVEPRRPDDIPAPRSGGDAGQYGAGAEALGAAVRAPRVPVAGSDRFC